MPPTTSERPYITCHVLDTITGKPAPGMTVTLQLLSPKPDQHPSRWLAQTNSDGRVTSWTNAEGAPSVNDRVAAIKAKPGMDNEAEMVWKLVFETEAYFGSGKTFWPQVELTFSCKVQEEHYHVPLLLGPWSYTTYRGS